MCIYNFDFNNNRESHLNMPTDNNAWHSLCMIPTDTACDWDFNVWRFIVKYEIKIHENKVPDIYKWE
jgi:hypothetical protein